METSVPALVFSDINDCNELTLYLVLTFDGGCHGIHDLHIDVVTPARCIGLDDFEFKWPMGINTYTEFFELNVQPDIYGLYKFLLSIDGTPLNELEITLTTHDHKAMP
jgi:hypothetical protein